MLKGDYLGIILAAANFEALITQFTFLYHILS